MFANHWRKDLVATSFAASWSSLHIESYSFSSLPPHMRQASSSSPDIAVWAVQWTVLGAIVWAVMYAVV